VGVEHHLLRLTGIGPDKRHAAEEARASRIEGQPLPGKSPSKCGWNEQEPAAGQKRQENGGFFATSAISEKDWILAFIIA
jgi:hypothetical protein